MIPVGTHPPVGTHLWALPYVLGFPHQAVVCKEWSEGSLAAVLLQRHDP